MGAIRTLSHRSRLEFFSKVTTLFTRGGGGGGLAGCRVGVARKRSADPRGSDLPPPAPAHPPTARTVLEQEHTHAEGGTLFPMDHDAANADAAAMSDDPMLAQPNDVPTK